MISHPVRRSRPLKMVLAAASAAVAALLIVPATSMSSTMLPQASAQPAPCPDIEVIFARGQGEAPGMGGVGDAFVTALQQKTGRPFATYAVNYPAANMDIAPGVGDMTAHIQSVAASCPGTRFLLGGYSLGGAVTYQVLNNGLPPDIDQRVIGAVTFGNAMRALKLPTDIPPGYVGRTLDQCNPGDPICSGGPFPPAHLQVAYIASGAVNTAANAAASRI